ncbi:olfactory receptor 51I1 [Trichechus manatus latirostris]|uniref:Olfactory receptor 51I1 n=1 Tax=Trichechus manatus latirostris TaxID=127582 RepID=A0A2Y9E8L5_TRIMA|nr:olfactory receptor 51I1 [Trichechus manatus latirostris]
MSKTQVQSSKSSQFSGVGRNIDKHSQSLILCVRDRISERKKVKTSWKTSSWAHTQSVFSHLPTMRGFSVTPFQPATLQLTGIPGMQTGQAWVALTFCILYLMSITGNLSILVLVVQEPALHQPMYCFLSMLSLNDLGVSLSTLPTVLATLCFNYRHVGFDACLVQMFFIHTFSFMESGMLLAMSFDNFVAICDPLHYATVLTNSDILALGLGILAKSFIALFPFPFLVKRLPFFKGNVLHHSYCLHLDLMKVACGDFHVNNVYGLFVVIVTYGIDSTFILLYYALILRAVLAIASQEQRLKALNTCMSHVCAVLAFYVSIIAVSMIHCFWKNAPPVVHPVMSSVYLFVPPMLNPIIYSVKTKEILRGILKVFQKSQN